MVIIIPSATYALSTIPVLPMGGNNDWAGFWGGYLGAIVGGVITLYVMFKSFQDSRENQERVLEIERLKEIKKEKSTEQKTYMEFFRHKPCNGKCKRRC